MTTFRTTPMSLQTLTLLVMATLGSSAASVASDATGNASLDGRVVDTTEWRFTFNDANSSRKIVGVGMCKAGTSTMHALMEQLGVHSVHQHHSDSHCKGPARMVAWVMYLNRAEGKPVFDGCLSRPQAYMQMDWFGRTVETVPYAPLHGNGTVSVCVRKCASHAAHDTPD
jgi:hypothetical protein